MNGMKKILRELQAEGQVIVDTYEEAERIREAAKALIGKKGFGNVTITRIVTCAALPARDGRHGYKVVTL